MGAGRNIWGIVVVILLTSLVGGIFFTQSMSSNRSISHETLSNSNFTQIGSVEWSNGTPSNPIISIVGSMAQAVALGDVNKDGRIEVISGSFDINETSSFHYESQASLRIWRFSHNQFTLLKEKVWKGANNGSASITDIVVYPYNGKTLIITAGTISTANASGGANPSYGDIRLWEFANGNINLISNATWRDYPDKNTTVTQIWVGYINGNNYPVIITSGEIYWSVGNGSNQANHSMAEITAWKINSDFSMSLIAEKIWTDPYINATSAQTVDVYDFDNDGNYEIVVGGAYGYIDSGGVNRTKAEISVWHLSGNSFVRVDDVTWIDLDNCAVFSIKIYDIDNDGKMEIIAAGTNKYGNTAGELSIWDYPLSQVARIQFYVDPEGQPGGAHWDCIGWRVIVGDFDNDGVVEMIVTGMSKGPPPPGASGTTVWGYLDVFHFDGSNIVRVTNYYWLDHEQTAIFDICYGDVDNDGQDEIFTVGYYTTHSGNTEYEYAKIYVWHYGSQVPEFSTTIFVIAAALLILLTAYKKKFQ